MNLQLPLFKFLKEFTIVLSISFSSSVILYYLLKAVYGYSPFACPILWRCWPYWDNYPLPYLVALTCSYSFFCTLWVTLFSTKPKIFQVLQFVIVPITAVLLGGYLSGIIWAYQDMQAGYFPPFSQAVEYIKGFALSGLFLSLPTAFASYPLNILAYLASIIISSSAQKLSSKG